MDECDEESDQNKCNGIKVEYDDFYCYKADLFNNPYSRCIAYPKKKEKQKMYWDILNGLYKELFSMEGKSIIQSWKPTNSGKSEEFDGETLKEMF